MAAEAGFGVVPLEQVRTMDGLTLINTLLGLVSAFFLSSLASMV